MTSMVTVKIFRIALQRNKMTRKCFTSNTNKSIGITGKNFHYTCVVYMVLFRSFCLTLHCSHQALINIFHKIFGTSGRTMNDVICVIVVLIIAAGKELHILCTYL